MKCFYCENELNKKEYNQWVELGKCCNGLDCCCMGEIIGPPICDKCIEKGDDKQ